MAISKTVRHKKEKTVALKDLRTNMAKYISRVSGGESFTVLRRSQPIFKISPPEEDEGTWETIVDFTQISKNGVPAVEVLRALKELGHDDIS
jgi:antitoxin (DNA-binding transcriptional repressor) of toxin-antitoxin stability system